MDKKAQQVEVREEPVMSLSEFIEEAHTFENDEHDDEHDDDIVGNDQREQPKHDCE